MAIHFGVKVLPGKLGLKLVRDKYALINNRSTLYKEGDIEIHIKLGFFDPDRHDDFDGKSVKKFEDRAGRFYTNEWCIEHQKQCLENFDLHMEFFSLLDRSKFNSEVEAFTQKYPMFEEVFELDELEDEPGYYVLVLDEYCQVYVGTSDSGMKQRIRRHWSNTKSFDRLLLPQGAPTTSIMSIDSFRALDTTRIFAYKTSRTFALEDKYIRFFSKEYCSNRLGGGKIEGGFIEAIAKMKQRKLIKK